MSTIIAGEYDTFDEAGRASDRLRAAGFDERAISVFFNNTPGRHGTFPIGGDELVDPQAHVLAGAASETQTGDEQDTQKVWRRPAGVIVAVALPEAAREDAALRALRDTGARNIERADGEIHDGNWTDFDPLAPPRLVDEPQRSAATT